jgi:hypothetical protein
MNKVRVRGSLLAVLVSAALFGLSGRPAAAANIVVNGSFEDTALDTNTWGVFGSIPGWTTAFGPGIEIQNNVAGSPFDGGQHVELDSDESSGIYQDLTTVPGAGYILKFAFSPRPGTDSSDNILNVSWGGNLVATLSADGSQLDDTSWQVFTYHLTAAGSTTRLEFDDAGFSNSLGTYLDAVSVEPEYSVKALYDQTKSHKLGSTVPIKIQVCVANGVNVSSSSLPVTATGLTKVDNTASTVEDSGSANSPDNNFRYDATLAGYIFNLSTTGLTTGTWVLSFTVGADPTVQHVQFDVK